MPSVCKQGGYRFLWYSNPGLSNIWAYTTWKNKLPSKCPYTWAGKLGKLTSCGKKAINDHEDAAFDGVAVDGPHTAVVREFRNLVSPPFRHVETLGVPDVCLQPDVPAFPPGVVCKKVLRSTAMAPRGRSALGSGLVVQLFGQKQEPSSSSTFSSSNPR
jgi:hypothetical protein